MLNKEQATYLLQRLMDDEATSPERARLAQMLQEEQAEDQWIDLLEELFHAQTDEVVYNEEEWKPVLQELLQKTRAQERKVVPLWRKFAVAASLVGLLFFAGYWLLNKKTTDNGPQTIAERNDVQAPDKNRAQIKLSDGTIIYLDSAVNGELAQQGNISVTKNADGQIQYSGPSSDPERQSKGSGLSTFNTLTNPRGSKILAMTLSDGSKVWLNAGSSMTYPVAFIGNERKVQIAGEGYFEVAHNAKMPFIVTNGDVQVKVLGTHFNVNAYEDEEAIRVTLLEGSVNVSRHTTHDSRLLKPGEQAIATPDSRLTTRDNIDLDVIMAWKNGRFEFKSTDLPTIMREVARWYDVEIVYQEQVNQRFNGKIPRTMSAMNIFKVLEETGGVHFKIEGKKVFVSK